MRYSEIVRRFLVATATVCSLLWAVTGVSVLAIALHEHYHHPEATHNHDESFEVVLHCHDNESAPHHDHELSAAMSMTRAQASVHGHVIATNFTAPEEGLQAVHTVTVRGRGTTARLPSSCTACY